MKILRATLFFGICGAMLAACGDDGGTAVVRKGEVDEGALVSGVTVNIAGATGSLVVPFSEPVPDVPDATFEAELVDATSLNVVSDQSGATADLMAGEITANPSGPGEWNWELNSDRDEATLTFFNETPGGLTLKPGNSYTAQLAVASNEYIETVSAIALDISVTGG